MADLTEVQASQSVKIAGANPGTGVEDNFVEVNTDGSLNVANVKSTANAVTSVVASVTSVTLLATNAARKGATIYNDSTATLYLKLGATASVTSHTLQMIKNSYYEIPFNYTGIIDAIWAAANGSARISELT